jgi:methyl-accepting chemotaxis protein
MNPHEEQARPRRRRLQKLPQPRIQLYLIGSFLAMSLLMLFLEHMLFVNRMSQLASELPNDGPVFLDRFPSALGSGLLLMLAGCIPLTFALGVLVTNGLVGPLQRIQDHLRAAARDGGVGPLRVRQRDRFGELADAINSALESKGRAGDAETRDAA